MTPFLAAVVIAAAAFLAAAGAVSAAGVDKEAKKDLAAIYAARSDLQQCFRSSDWKAIPTSRTKGLTDLEAWARAYGYREYPQQLAAYAPANLPVDPPVTAAKPPPVLAPRATGRTPVLRDGASFNFSRLTADAVFVVDAASREVLLAHNSRTVRPIASITKLMTAMVMLDRQSPSSRLMVLSPDDEVGGARLQVPVGTKLSLTDLFNAMIIGSANNAAHACARSTGMGVPEFVAAMNAKAASCGLASTRFTDPTGIDTGNVSTAQEVAALGLEAFENYAEIERSASTASYDIPVADQVHRIRNTDGLLTDESNGLVVTGGKTGYLNESKWNLVVRMSDGAHRPVVVVILGSDTEKLLFREAASAAKWAWQNYTWVRK